MELVFAQCKSESKVSLQIFVGDSHIFISGPGSESAEDAKKYD